MRSDILLLVVCLALPATPTVCHKAQDFRKKILFIFNYTFRFCLHFKNISHSENKYDMTYLLTAFGLTPGGSSTVHIYTQTVHRTTQITTEQQK